MCQARPGTRCSSDARETYNKAINAYDKAEYELFAIENKVAAGMHVSDEQYNGAREKMRQVFEARERAERQWYETPDGIQELRNMDNIEAATIYSQVREYRRQSLNLIEADRRGQIVPVPTKGIANAQVEFDSGANTFKATIRKEDPETGRMDSETVEGTYEHNLTMDGYIYKSPATGVVRVKTEHARSPEAGLMLKKAMAEKSAPEHTFVDREGAYAQSKAREAAAVEASVAAGSDSAEAYKEASLAHGELRAWLNKDKAEPGNKDTQRQLAHAQEEYDIASRRSNQAFYALRRAEGMEDISKQMSKVVRTSSNRNEAIKMISEMEPNPPTELNGVHFYVDGFERQRRRLIQEAVNYTW